MADTERESKRVNRRAFLTSLSLGGLGGLIMGSGAGAPPGGGDPHSLLSDTHDDTVPGTVVRGDVIVGDATPEWKRLARGTLGQKLNVNADGDLAWDSDLHNLLSSRHGDTVAANPTRGAIIYGDSTPKWAKLGLPGARWQLWSDGTDLLWDYPGMQVDGMTIPDTIITTTGENQAPITILNVVNTLWKAEWMILCSGPANAQLTFDGEIHDPNHFVMETFQFSFAPTGAGDIFRTTSTIWGMRAAGFPGGGNFHLNVTERTGGTVTVKVRTLWGGA